MQDAVFPGVIAGDAGELADHMNRTVTRPEDRAMFDFLPDPPPAASEGFAGAADPDKKRESES